MYRILLAEDNPGDVLLFQEAIRERNIPCEIVVAEDGLKAITILHAINKNDRRLDLIVLDVNLPKHNGAAVLREVRSHDSLHGVPIIMLTSSSSPADKATAANLGASAYIQKSSDLDELLEVGKVVEGILLKGSDTPRPPD